jgi:glycerol uptake facilitator-like aquaporin
VANPCRRHRPTARPALVASWIFAAYWFTASTSFANPAVTLARALTQSFAGIRGIDVAGFVIAQLAGAALALAVVRLLFAPPTDSVQAAQSRDLR